MSNTRRFVPLLWAALAFAAYAWLAGVVAARSKPEPGAELVVRLPLAAQVLFAGGDRYLAANLSGFRVLVAASERMQAPDYAVQARLQRDIAWLNPLHEDNYYIAAAVLPWAGEIDAAQYVLRTTANARRFDWMPLFYYGFGEYYFHKDPAAGAKALLEAVDYARDEQDALALRLLALKWTERGYSTATAAGVVGAMARTSPPGAFKKYLEKRATRLGELSRLRDAAKRYEAAHGRPLQALDQLVTAGLLTSLPRDPLGIGYKLDARGTPVFGEQ